MRGFSVKAIVAVQDVPEGFDAFICFLCAVSDLTVESDVVFAAVAEEDLDADVMLRRQRGGAAR